jgi:hypothetical protein
MAAVGTHLQIGISALDTEEELVDRLMLMGAYAGINKPGTVAKVMTAPFVDSYLRAKQDSLVTLALDYRFMELPLRVFKSNPMAYQFDWKKMRKHWNGISKREDNQWTAGPLYAPKEGYKEELQGDETGTYYLCGEVTCDTCPHKCATAW